MKVITLSIYSCLISLACLFHFSNQIIISPPGATIQAESNVIPTNTDSIAFCQTTEKWQAKIAQDTMLGQKEKFWEHQAYQYLSKGKSEAGRAKMLYTLPVVFHIVHENGDENISDVQVNRAVDYMNEAFANQGYYNQGEGVDVDIQFCLARRKPDGSVTTGINRIVSDLTDIQDRDDELRDLSRWDPTCYINIWVVKEIGGSVAGYAYLPSAHGEDFDGIVCKAAYVGNNRVGTTVLVHEMGHYLGLQHTFEGGCGNNDCLRDGDMVCDTPPDQSTAAVPCNVGANTCNTDTDDGFAEDQPDMINNYMDYGDLDCYNTFTQGQKDRMHYFLTNVRQSLLSCPSCLDPCPAPIEVSIQTSADSLAIAGNLTLSANSSNTDNVSWTVNGVTAGDGFELNFVGNTLGRQEIIFTGTSNNPDCLARMDTLYIDVYCPIKGEIQINQSTVLVGEEVTLLSNFGAADEVTWIINGNEVGSGEEFVTVFDTPGNFEVYAEASNSNCSFLSAPLFLFINDDCNYDGEVYQMELDRMGIPYWMEKADDGGYYHFNTGGFVKLDENKKVEWGTGGYAIFRDIALNRADGSAIMVGSYSAEVGGVFVTQMSATGEAVWTKTIVDDANPMQTRIFEIVEDENGDFLVLGGVIDAGESSVEEGVAFLYKINQQGEILYRKIFELMVLRKLSITSDNGCLLIGEYGDPDLGAFNLIKLDENGNQEWSNMYIPESPPWLMVTDLDFELERVADQDYLLSFHTGYGEGEFLDFVPRPYFMKVNEEGDIQWTKRVSFPDTILFQEIEGLVQLPDGDMVFTLGTGGSNNDGYNFSNYGSIDLDGNLQWARKKAMVFPYTTDIYYLDQNEIAILGLTDNNNNTLFIDELGFSADCPIENGEITVQDFSFVSFPFDVVERNNYNLNYETADNFLYRILTFQVPLCSSGGITAFDGNLTLDSLENCGNSLIVNMTVCNWGNKTISASTPVTFYDANPTLGIANRLDEVIQIGQEILPDSCEVLRLTLAATLEESSLIYAVINDDGTGPMPYNFEEDFPLTEEFECNFNNNLDSIDIGIAMSVPTSFSIGSDTTLCPGESLTLVVPDDLDNVQWEEGSTIPRRIVRDPGLYWLSVTNICGEVLTDSIRLIEVPANPVDLGPDQFVCSNQIFTFKTETVYDSYEWQDGASAPTYTAWLPGIYWLDATDECGRVYRDSVEIILNEATSFDLGPDTLICVGQSVRLRGVDNFPQYDWFPKENISCSDCQEVLVSPDSSTTYTLIAELEPGCISTDTIRIEVGYPTLEEEAISICAGTSTLIFEEMQDTAGIYVKTYQSQAGCDSTVRVSLDLIPAIETRELIRICEGESVPIFGEMQSIAGSYLGEFVAASTACDSFHTIQLEVLDTMVVSEQINICEGQSISLFGEEQNTSGTYSATFTGQNDCDSTHTYILSVVDTVRTFESIAICQGEQVNIFGQERTEAGLFAEGFNTLAGCDSIHQIELIILDTLTTFASLTICEGESISIFGQEQTNAGIFHADFTAINGCDSTHYITLEVLDTVATFEQLSICEGDSLLAFGQYWMEAGQLSSTFSARNACDSTHYITLEVLDTIATFEQLSICQGDSLLAFGQYWRAAGLLSNTSSATNGCDSTHYITLEVLDTVATFEQLSICEGDSLLAFGQYWTEPGLLSGFFTAINGCDSMHYITLEVLDTVMTFEQLSICEGDSLLAFGQYWTESGFLSGTSSGANGCDSTHNIALQVLDTVATFEQLSICEGDSLLAFGQYWTDPGQLSATFSASNGCDSTHYIDLSVLANSFTSEAIRLCPGDSAFIFGQWVSVEGIFQAAYPAANACDSIHQIEVIIESSILITPSLESACFAEENGQISLTLTGGSPPYLVNWDNGAQGTILEGIGTGSYAVTVMDQNACETQTEFEVLESEPIRYDIDWQNATCLGETDGQITVEPLQESLTFSLNGGAFQTTGTFSNLSMGTYKVGIQDENGCIIEETLSIIAPDEVNLVLPTRMDIIRGDSVPIPLNGELSRITTIEWSPQRGLSCTDCLRPLTYTTEDQSYQLSVIDDNGCETLREIQIQVKSVPEIEPPTAFSPNGDGMNDLFVIPELERYEKPELIVVNRWGAVVYQAKPYQNDWDGENKNGKVLPEGTYYYLLYLDVASGKVVSGPIAIIR